MIDIFVNYKEIIIPVCLVCAAAALIAAFIFRRNLLPLYKKHKMIVMYLIFGVLTTVINIVAFDLISELFPTVVSNVIAWFLSVIFAFFTNKYYVFDAEGDASKSFIAQLAAFFAARIISGVIDTAVVYIFIDIAGFNKLAVKIISNIFVIIFNYVASKLVIFKKK